jgi:hypothetical protein
MKYFDISGSTAEQWSNCPSSRYVGPDDAPKQPANEAMLRGSAIHAKGGWLLAEKLREKFKDVPIDVGIKSDEVCYVGETYRQDGDDKGIVFDEEMEEYAQWYAMTAFNNISNFDENSDNFALKHVIIDKQFQLENIRITPDLMCWFGEPVHELNNLKDGFLYIADLKTGRFIVNPERNAQLKCYHQFSDKIFPEYFANGGERPAALYEVIQQDNEYDTPYVDPAGDDMVKKTIEIRDMDDKFRQAFSNDLHRDFLDNVATPGKACTFCKRKDLCKPYLKQQEEA